MPTEVEPLELARLLDTAERSRAGDWSLRSALVRYAQPQPRRVSAVLEVLRRIEVGLRPHMKRIAKDGPALWAALGDGAAGGDDDDPARDLLRALAMLDGLGDRLASWALDPGQPASDEEVDVVVGALAAELDRLGVPREQHEDRARQPRRGR